MHLTHCAIFDCSYPDQPRPMASFALDDDGHGHLGYGKHYLKSPDALLLDPVHLALTTERQMIRRRSDSSYGVLSDAGPNAWGVKLTTSIHRQLERPQPVTAIDWFIHSWHFGSGCLGFSEHHTMMPEPGIVAAPLSDLTERMIHVVEALSVDADTEIDVEAARLFSPGGSLGGVRPKTVVMHEGIEYIAKLGRPDDGFDVPLVEYATLRLAHAAGIGLPDFELVNIGNRSVLLVERFDRCADGRRIHYLSANTLIDIDQVRQEQYAAGYSYAGIVDVLRKIGDHVQVDAHELFRRMVFNIMVGNVDDHMRNHAVLMDAKGRYRLSPAFDIVPHRDASYMPQSIGVGAYGAASTIENALSQCGRFLLTLHEAKHIVEEVRTVVNQWRSVFRESGVTSRDIHLLTSCFAVADRAEGV